jgi:hypothetical protein
MLRYKVLRVLYWMILYSNNAQIQSTVLDDTIAILSAQHTNRHKSTTLERRHTSISTMARCPHLLLLVLLSGLLLHKASSFHIISKVNSRHAPHHWTFPRQTTVLSRSSTGVHNYKPLLHLSASHSNDEKPYFLRKALMAGTCRVFLSSAWKMSLVRQTLITMCISYAKNNPQTK